jgi:hypothetical protein
MSEDQEGPPRENTEVSNAVRLVRTNARYWHAEWLRRVRQVPLGLGSGHEMGQSSRPGLVARVRHFKYRYTSPLQPTPISLSSWSRSDPRNTPDSPLSDCGGARAQSCSTCVVLTILGLLGLILAERLSSSCCIGRVLRRGVSWESV